MVFTWVAPPAIDHNGIITYYVVKLHEIETDIVWTFFAVDEDISIGSLHPFYYYDCTVAASTSAGTGPRSTAIRVQMDEAGQHLHLAMKYCVTVQTTRTRMYRTVAVLFISSKSGPSMQMYCHCST